MSLLTDRQAAKKEIWELAERLYPIHRTLVNEGFNKSLDIISDYLDLNILSYASGQSVYDWVIPKSWNVKEAYIENSKGVRLVDFQDNNLHLAAYSESFEGYVSHDELMSHIKYLDDQPDAIPYNYLYIDGDWIFNIRKETLSKFDDNKYKVVIEVDEKDDYLRIGEKYLPGQTEDEILITSYLCHPSMANDNVSGVVAAVEIFKQLSELENRKYSYRLLIQPETIGAVTYLSNTEESLDKVFGGFSVYCCGDDGPVTYKRSYSENSYIDRIIEFGLSQYKDNFRVKDFYPGGSDERQFNAPGVRLNFGAFTRSQAGEFSEYHTSKDTLDFISVENLIDTVESILGCIYVLEKDQKYLNNFKGEPCFSKHNISYPTQKDAINKTSAYNVKIVTSEIDGNNTLMEISKKWNIPFDEVVATVNTLEDSDLIKEL